MQYLPRILEDLLKSLGLGFRVWSLGFRVQGLGFGVRDSGFRTLGFRVRVVSGEFSGQSSEL